MFLAKAPIGLPKPAFLNKIPNGNVVPGFLNKVKNQFPLRPGPVIQPMPQNGRFHAKPIERM